MRTTDTLIIGAGQAGLAASHHLTSRDREHVVLERGRIAQRWLTETWDSLHLLTPNWVNGLPGWVYDGPDPDGFMSAGELAGELASYAGSFHSPVEQETSVEVVRRHGEAFEVLTDQGAWRAGNVVIATGWCQRPAVPAMARQLLPGIYQVAPAAYRSPDGLPPGGVLVVGASATGIQLADELRAAGRDVILAVGRHSRMPRRYRGMDAFWWFDCIGLLDKTIDEMPDPHLARHEPSVQLVGRPDHRSLDLATLAEASVRLAGRLVSIDGSHARFAPDLAASVGAADDRMTRVLAQIDAHIDRHGLRDEVLETEPPRPVRIPPETRSIDLRTEGIGSIVWATGHRRSYDWLQIPVLDERGEIRQRRGVTPVVGLYVLGQRFQHYRSSNFIGGVGRDAAFVVDHLAGNVAMEGSPPIVPVH